MIRPGAGRMRCFIVVILLLFGGTMPVAGQTTLPGNEPGPLKPDDQPLPPGFAILRPQPQTIPLPGRSPARCPRGYTEADRTRALPNYVICRVDTTLPSACRGDGVYSCGRDARECCAVSQNNPCFPGSYACSADADRPGAPRVACCTSR